MDFQEEDLPAYEDLFTFGLDCVKACMETYGIMNWENSYTTPRSPLKRCTDSIRRLVKQSPKIREMKVHNKLFTYFEGWFENDERSCCDKDFEAFAEFLTSELCLGNFEKDKFIHYCCMIGHMSVKLFTEKDMGVYRAIEAPDYAFCCIAFALMHFKKENQFHESTWAELDAYADSVLAKTRTSSRKHT
ncbi:hypothetical protein JTE90_015053 [Oedothorax gibbosus]|uniref:Uncharacterized protein n=1 Tax=Oedothorax gibbosus TaxID=931172 RepID=A0AAV6U1Z4_9ARAC|nr:hypothetical protein JTE90_015053 [Oedothorax gibbosus]